MKKLTMLAAIIGTAGALTLAAAPQASAAESFSFSFSVGDVSMAYRDGYYDRASRWHAWASPREMRAFSARYAGRYRDHDRRADRRSDYRADHRTLGRVDARAWDWDRDGVPNRFDRAPRNPYRY